MAEVAGLVIGGISLTALFGQCISIIKYVDSGTNCNKEYQDAALMLMLLGGRLNRWERTLRESADGQTKEDGKIAESWLERIRDRLVEAEELGKQYTVGQPANTAASTNRQSTDTSSVFGKIRGKLLPRDNQQSIVKRARWALRDQDKMRVLLDKLDKFISSLEQYFPSLQSRREDTAKEDFFKLSAPGSDAESLQFLKALKIAAEKYDKELNAAATSSSHAYREINITNGVMVNTRDCYSEGWAKAGGPIGQGGGDYRGVSIIGSAATLGNMYGGSSVVEIKRN